MANSEDSLRQIVRQIGFSCAATAAPDTWRENVADSVILSEPAWIAAISMTERMTERF
jgi:hypothetical protein